MNQDTLQKNLWDLSNIITGFAVVQTVAFRYACAKPAFANFINTLGAMIIMSILFFIVTIAEVCAVWWCSQKAILLSNTKEEKVPLEVTKIISQAAGGRLITIIAFMIPTMLALWSEQLRGAPFKS